MIEGEWRLGYDSYDNHPGANLTFGRRASGIYCLSEPDVSFADMDVADASLPGEDGVRMGRDYQRAATVSFELGVDGVDGPIDRHWPMRPWAKGDRVGEWSDSEAVAASYGKRDQGPHEWGLDGVDLLRQVWHADGIRARAGRVAWLVHKNAGRSRRLYGRPRKIAVSHSRLARQGFTPMVADFQAVDDRFYDSEESEAELYDHHFVGLPPRPGRPQPAGYETQKTTMVRHVGKVSTYPYLEVYGPCKNPKVTLSDLWSVQLSMSIADGDYVEINPRPWVRTVTHYKGSSTSSVADKLTRASPRLSEMFIPPGYWTAHLSYTKLSTRDFDGPRVRIAWRNAYAWW